MSSIDGDNSCAELSAANLTKIISPKNLYNGGMGKKLGRNGDPQVKYNIEQPESKRSTLALSPRENIEK